MVLVGDIIYDLSHIGRGVTTESVIALIQDLTPHWDAEFSRFEIATKITPSSVSNQADDPKFDTCSAALVGYDAEGHKQTVVSTGGESKSILYRSDVNALVKLHELVQREVRLEKKDYKWKVIASSGDEHWKK